MRIQRPRLARSPDTAAGFTLFEALAAVALMSAIVFAIGMVAAQWLPNWHRGFIRVQRAEILGLGIERIVADLSAALYVTPNGAAKSPIFSGGATSVIFVRDAIGPNATPHLEVVRLSEAVDGHGFALVRAVAPYVPTALDAPPGQFNFADPVVLVRAPFRISFAFAGADRAWRDVWVDNALLPAAVRVNVRDAATDQVLSVSTVTPLHVNVSPDCVRQKSAFDCANGIAEQPPAAQPSPAAGQPAAGQPAAGQPATGQPPASPEQPEPQ